MRNLKEMIVPAEDQSSSLAVTVDEISVDAKVRPGEFLKDSIVKAGGE